MTQFHGKIEETIRTEHQKLVIRKNIPAFPVQKYDGSWIDGMALRDYFAAKAMQADITGMRGGKAMEYSDISKRAYKMADTMMKAREENK